MQFLDQNNSSKIGTAFTVNDDALASKIDNVIAANSTDKYTSVFDTSSTNNFEIKVPESLVNPTINGFGNKSQIDSTNNNEIFTSKADNSKNRYASVLDTSSTSNFGIKMPESFVNQNKNDNFALSSSTQISANKDASFINEVTPSLIGYGMPSPTVTDGNISKYGINSWQNTISNAKNDALAYKSPYSFNNCRIREYDFDKSDYYALSEGIGLSGRFEVEGKSSIINDNILNISVSVKQYRPELEISGSVCVIQNGRTLAQKKIEKQNSSYFYQTGGFKPLGEAKIELPLTGKYKVRIDISAIIKNELGRAANNCTIYLPYSK